MINADTLGKIILSTRSDISNKKLQKLAYYVYAWYITIYNKPIADILFEAWEHGPVCRELYNKYKKYGWNCIPQYKDFLLADDRCILFVKSVLNYYGNFSADELEEMSHNEKPWFNAREGYDTNEACDEIILIQDMIDYYKEKKSIKKVILEEYNSNFKQKFRY